MTNTLRGTVVNDDPNAAGPTGLVNAPHLFRVIVGSMPLLGGARHRLKGVSEIVVGRRSKAIAERVGEVLTIGVPDARMSTKHARFVKTLAGWVLDDLGSTNGTFLDGTKVSRTEAIDGAIIVTGSTIWSFRTSLPCDPSGPADLESDSLRDRAQGLVTLVPSGEAALASLGEVARAGVSVLLLGPSGAGKEVSARAVHSLSGRPGAFVAVNCGALPETLLESQLFGHMKGAFSGAVKDELGFVRASDGGTLFLDEIGDMPRPSQVALLRVLQEREVTPVGATRPVKVDLRVVAATHRPVDALEAAGFRSDLYARLAGYTHRLIPLAERNVDVGILVADLLRKIAPTRAESITFTPALARALVTHPWPLNVRELEQALSVAVLLAKDGVVDLVHAPESVRNPPVNVPVPVPVNPVNEPKPATATAEDEDAKLRDDLVKRLRAHKGNVTYVANDMGKTRMQIHRWMRRFGIDPDTFR